MNLRDITRPVLCLGAFAVALASLRPIAGQELLSGAAFRRAMAEPIGPITWAEKPLRGALERLVETQHVAIMLDRRIDPDQKIDFSARDLSLEALTQALAQKHGASACRVGSVIYVGPAQTTHVLPTVVAKQLEKARELKTDSQTRLLKASSWSWPRMSTPRELIDVLERQYSIKVVGKENVPHDLWPAVQLPPLNFIEKLSLVLAGFHVTFELSPLGDAVRLVAMPADAKIQRRYSPRGDAAALATQLAQQFPQAKFVASGRNFTVDGPWEVHDAVERLLAGERVSSRPRPTEGKQVYTLTLENKPVGGVIRALGTQLGRTVSLEDVKVQSRLTREISLQVENVSLEELLQQVLSPAGLKFELQGETIRVYD